MDDDAIEKHSFKKYCGFCHDSWSPNHIANDWVKTNPPPLTIMWDELYKRLVYMHGLGDHLEHVIKSSDLIRALDQPHFEIVRPGEDPKPYCKCQKPVDNDDNSVIYIPPPRKTKYRPCLQCLDDSLVHPLTETLKVLKLKSFEMRFPMRLMVPFFLKSLPDLKTFGRSMDDLVEGLKLAKRQSALQRCPEPITGKNLETVTYTHGMSLTAFQGPRVPMLPVVIIHEDMKAAILDFCVANDTQLHQEVTMTVEESRQSLRKNLDLLAQDCPNARELILKLNKRQLIFSPIDSTIWTCFDIGFQNLTKLSVSCHRTIEFLSLIRIVGPRIQDLEWNFEAKTLGDKLADPAILDVMLDLLPNLVTLKLCHVPILSSHYQNAIEDTVHKSKLRSISVTGFSTTYDVFRYILGIGKDLKHIDLPFITDFPFEMGGLLATRDIDEMFRMNPLLKLKTFKVKIALEDLRAGRCFLGHLPKSCQEVSNVKVWIDFPDTILNLGAEHDQVKQEYKSLVEGMESFTKDMKENAKRQGRKLDLTYDKQPNFCVIHDELEKSSK